ncbi:MAG: DUF4430 domain-containing protein [Mobilitalea sp.]
MNKNKKLWKILLSCAVFVLVIVAMLAVYYQFKPEAQKGAKDIVVEVVIPDESTEEFKINTDAENLRQALEEKDLVKGSESEYGLFVTEVNGRVVDDSKQEWWNFTKSGEMLSTGVDDTMIADGDHYEITLTTGY